ncbi:hypothetical protein Hanom_Chr05g00414151 [Helianthus anomalus]
MKKFQEDNQKFTFNYSKMKEAYDELKRVSTNYEEHGRMYFETQERIKSTVEDKQLSINKYLDDVASLKLKLEETKIENERVVFRLKSYSTVRYILEHIIPKPIGKNKDGEDVYNNGGGVGYNRCPPPINDDYT